MSVPQTDVVEDEALEEEDETVTTEEEPVTDNVGDPSVEINIEQLIQALEAESLVNSEKRTLAARHRLEELMESRRSKRDLEDFDDYKI
jgi:hypothetical protein